MNAVIFRVTVLLDAPWGQSSLALDLTRTAAEHLTRIATEQRYQDGRVHVLRGVQQSTFPEWHFRRFDAQWEGNRLHLVGRVGAGALVTVGPTHGYTPQQAADLVAPLALPLLIAGPTTQEVTS